MSDKYALIDAERADPMCELPVRRMCAALGVSTSGFYEWAGAGVSARAARRARVAEHVVAAFDAGRGAYGVRRVHAVLARSDDPQVASASSRLVRAVMAELGLRACQPRAYRSTTRRDHDHRGGVGDHVGRDFSADAPGVKFVGDVTYVRTWQGWLYLATVIDCHTRGVVGWSMAETMRADLVCDAVTMAAANTSVVGAVFHSDRGSQYTSTRFAAHLESLGITASMGRTGVCLLTG